MIFDYSERLEAARQEFLAQRRERSLPLTTEDLREIATEFEVTGFDLLAVTLLDNMPDRKGH